MSNYYNFIKRKYNAKVADPIWYKGGLIWKAVKNASGIKYYYYGDNGVVRSDSLVGIKKIIKNERY